MEFPIAPFKFFNLFQQKPIPKPIVIKDDSTIFRSKLIHGNFQERY